MEPLRALSPVTGSVRVSERQAGGRQQTERFQQALQHEAHGREQESSAEANASSQRAMRTGLQRQAVGDRKDLEQGRHVDVIA